LFTNDPNLEKHLLHLIPFGGGCINDTILHLATTEMGFGGVGSSGMGAYHGKVGFDTFSHHKSILKKSNVIDLRLRYAPYDETKGKIIKHLMK
jgi:aldehyde dehydrogenase (NAD+)